MPKIIDYSKRTDPFHRLLLALVPLDKSDYEELRDQNKELNEKEEMKKKGRPKKEEKEKKIDDSYATSYSFEERLSFELKSLELED
ncbi:hypothetical protein M9Y10_000071 [Tritrichomonas musculus]|uniref:Uncharacterized protein n=1 Tax=Tritrichomonas musculus TaxID=1915356 RepID=A0ABR2L475_9EUKA